ncbi:ankyrin repeat-containing protein BDA1 [Coffea arabica]|uniref:Ankyrin repeat-containing protein BDA1 n=1 Tax=Coffea arabica TaxID=13443 RepID=A0A6P6TVM4_COFAR|nr:ankyrin repeat-containing protein BDA1-like isoform X1 [Coffea arabica]
MEQTLDVVQQVLMAAQENNIDAFYGLLGQDPYILDRIDTIPFVQTPLHTAASAGSTHFASEVLRLKPSFGKKLSLDGLSALDLALRGGHTQTVRGLIKHDPQLIRVEGKKGITPLHYVSEAEDRADLLAEFLYRCPKSIEDLTIAGESAVHIAVNNSNLRGFKVLLGWMEETGNKHILEWEDENGNTVLHLAASSRNNIEAARLIIKQRTFRRAINCCNVAGLTALDIALGHPNAEEHGSIAKALCAAGAKRSTSHSKTINLADYCALIPARSWLGHFSAPNYRLVKVPNPRNPSINSMSGEKRSALLVVAVLIATATYQAILNPPGGLASGNTDISTNSTSNSTDAGYGNPQAGSAPLLLFPNFGVGTAQAWELPFIIFITFNSVLFALSLLTICFLVEANDTWGKLLKPALAYFSICYAISLLIITPDLLSGGAGAVGMLVVFCWPRGMLQVSSATARVVRNAIRGETIIPLPRETSKTGG